MLCNGSRCEGLILATKGRRNRRDGMMLLNLLSFVANHHPVRFFRVFIKLPLGCNRRGRFLLGVDRRCRFLV